MNKLNLLLLLLFLSVPAFPCTKISWETEDMGIFIARSEDFQPDAKPTIEIRPKGELYQKDENISWSSKYSSMMISVFDLTFVEGLNEEGFSASVLSLDEETGLKVLSASGSNKNNNIKDLSNILMIPYLVDNFKSVDEAVNNLKELNISVYHFPDGEKLGGHYMLQDQKGDVAIIEFVDNKMNVYRGEEHNVLTNSPSYDEHLKNWQNFTENELSKDKSLKEVDLPGGYKSSDRFIRAKFNIDNISDPIDISDGIGKVCSAIPTIPQLKDHTTTQYIVSYNLNEKDIYIRYQFDSYFTQFNFDFNSLNDGKFYYLDIKDKTLAGAVEDRFSEKKGIMEKYR